MNDDRKAGVMGDEMLEALKEDVKDEVATAHDPGIESDEEIDGEVDAAGGSALKRRSD